MNRNELLFIATTVLGIRNNDWHQVLTISDAIYIKDDGLVPNSKYHLQRYKNAFYLRNKEGPYGWKPIFLNPTGAIPGKWHFYFSALPQNST